MGRLEPNTFQNQSLGTMLITMSPKSLCYQVFLANNLYHVFTLHVTPCQHVEKTKVHQVHNNNKVHTTLTQRETNASAKGLNPKPCKSCYHVKSPFQLMTRQWPIMYVMLSTDTNADLGVSIYMVLSVFNSI